MSQGSDPVERVVVQAPVRIGRRTKDLVKQLLPGEIAVIDHADLDRVAAEGLVEADAAAVLNAATSMTGRYPNYGPLLVVASGTLLVDDLGSDLLDVLTDGDIVTVVENEVWRGEEQLATGMCRDVHELEDHIEQARHTLGAELEKFATNTLQYLKRERHLATDSPDLPPVRVPFKDRHALVVVRGVDYREDLAALKRSGYLREVKPVMIGVDGGADALLELGLKPDIIMGDFDSVSDVVLRCGAELIVHAYLDGKAPGADRLDVLALDYEQFETAGTSEDIAMLLAHELGAQLIVAVGTHNSMEEFLDKGRVGMASTFLVRLRVGVPLVDAKGVNRLYRPVVKTRDITVLVLGALAALLAVTLVNEPLRLWLRSLWTYLRSGVGLMINIRYHVYSLVAVFLALAIGVAAGSTVVQRSVVDNLKSTQGRIEQNLDDLEAQNAALQERTAALEGRDSSLTAEGPGTFLAGELADVPVILVRSEGASGDVLGRVREVLKLAGAEIVSEVELKAALSDPDAVATAATDLGLELEDTAPEQVQAAIGERLGALIALVSTERPSTPVTSGPTVSDTTGTDTAPPATDALPSSAVRDVADFLRLLDDSGMASVRGPLGDPGVTTEGLEVLALGGLTRDFDPVAVLRPLLDTLAAEGGPMALAADGPLDQPLGEGEEAYGVVATVRGNGRLRGEVSTVDHVGDFAGLSALVLGLAGLADGQVGHYGDGDGADSLLPSRR